MNWQPGEDVIVAGSVSDDEAKEAYPQRWKGAATLHSDRAAAALIGAIGLLRAAASLSPWT